jgi:hypothetical protein
MLTLVTHTDTTLQSSERSQMVPACPSAEICWETGVGLDNKTVKGMER